MPGNRKNVGFAYIRSPQGGLSHAVTAEHQSVQLIQLTNYLVKVVKSMTQAFPHALPRRNRRSSQVSLISMREEMCVPVCHTESKDFAVQPQGTKMLLEGEKHPY